LITINYVILSNRIIYKSSSIILIHSYFIFLNKKIIYFIPFVTICLYLNFNYYYFLFLSFPIFLIYFIFFFFKKKKKCFFFSFFFLNEKLNTPKYVIFIIFLKFWFIIIKLIFTVLLFSMSFIINIYSLFDILLFDFSFYYNEFKEYIIIIIILFFFFWILIKWILNLE